MSFITQNELIREPTERNPLSRHDAPSYVWYLWLRKKTSEVDSTYIEKKCLW